MASSKKDEPWPRREQSTLLSSKRSNTPTVTEHRNAAPRADSPVRQILSTVAPAASTCWIVSGDPPRSAQYRTENPPGSSPCTDALQLSSWDTTGPCCRSAATANGDRPLPTLTSSMSTDRWRTASTSWQSPDATDLKRHNCCKTATTSTLPSAKATSTGEIPMASTQFIVALAVTRAWTTLTCACRAPTCRGTRPATSRFGSTFCRRIAATIRKSKPTETASWSKDIGAPCRIPTPCTSAPLWSNTQAVSAQEPTTARCSGLHPSLSTRPTSALCCRSTSTILVHRQRCAATCRGPCCVRAWRALTSACSAISFWAACSATGPGRAHTL
mmetsp:Transcript_89569/g.240179  ORF Transcript_89569/g.240179 Transcript_89569/m.240179 type:complete len:330 (+) Transcript_89569:975-1964(+)